MAGCGGDGGGGSFVATPDTGGAGGGGVPAGQTGSVTFNFTQAQAAPIVVPTGTERLRFEFFPVSDGGGNALLRETRNYNTTITIEGVPVTARSVVITAFGADGFPTAQFEANITVLAQQNIVVSLTNGRLSDVTLDSITVAPLSLSLGEGDSVRLDVFAVFSSGDRVKLNAAHLAEASFVSSSSTVASVDENVVSAVGTGTATVTITFRGQPVAVPVSVNVGPTVPPIASALTVRFADAPEQVTSVTLPTGTQTEQPLVFTASFDGLPDQTVTLPNVTFFSGTPGITVGADQRIVVGSSVPPGTTGQIRFTYEGQTSIVTVTVSNAVLEGIVVDPAAVSIPFGGFEQAIAVRGRFSDGTNTERLLASDLNFVESSSRFEVEIRDQAAVIVSQPLTSAGTDVLTVSYVRDSRTFEAEVEVEVGVRYVQQLEINPVNLSLNPGESREVTVSARLDNNELVDVSAFLALEAESDGPGVLVNGRNIVGVSADQIVTFTLPGSGNTADGNPANDDAKGSIAVDVVEITLTSVEHFYAGNPLAASVDTVNLPRGYVGIFEVQGTFSNGAIRRLRADEYTIAKNGGARNPAAIQLFQPGYTLRQPDANFTDLQPGDRDLLGAPITYLGPIEGSVYHWVDDLVFTNPIFGPRQVVANAPSSNADQVTVKGTFRGVAADWYRSGAGRYKADGIIPDYNVGGGDVAPASSANIEIAVNGYPEFDRTVSVTITDPAGPATVESVKFVNYPGDPNIARNTPRELEVRVNFPAATLPLSLPPFALAQNGFKLAEANVEFATDDLTSTTGPLPHYTDLIHHRATELGYIGVTANVPVNVGLILVTVQPIGGVAIAPVLESLPEFVIDDLDTPEVGTEINPESYTAGGYGHDLAVFGQATGLTVFEPAVVIDGVFDPGPTLVGGELSGRQSRSPSEGHTRIYTEFDNEGEGFRVVNPLSFTIDPNSSPFELQVGASKVFRVLVRWALTEGVKDVSLDYSPVLVDGLTETDVVAFPNSVNGNLVISGVNAAGDGAVVRALDVAGALIAPAGTGSTNTVNIQVTSPD